MENTSLVNQAPKSGSISVYQRMMPNKRPAKVEIIRSVYESCQGPGGKTFSRSNNTVLLRIPSGCPALSEAHRKKLLDDGLDAHELECINTRLESLAGPARECELAMDLADAEESIDRLVSLSNEAPTLAESLRSMLTDAVSAIEVNLVSDGGSSELNPQVVSGMLKATFAVFNKACLSAQVLYKSLPKGELPDDVVLEFQKSWFAHQDMLNTLRNRKSLSRPSRWPALRAQVLEGQIYKLGDVVLDGAKTSVSNFMDDQ